MLGRMFERAGGVAVTVLPQQRVADVELGARGEIGAPEVSQAAGNPFAEHDRLRGLAGTRQGVDGADGELEPFHGIGGCPSGSEERVGAGLPPSAGTGPGGLGPVGECGVLCPVADRAPVVRQGRSGLRRGAQKCRHALEKCLAESGRVGVASQLPPLFERHAPREALKQRARFHRA